MSGDIHTPTADGPDDSEPSAWSPPVEPTEPTETVAHATDDRPAGSAAPGWDSQPVASGSAAPAASPDRPEVFVGAAFAGGLVSALILKRLARD